MESTAKYYVYEHWRPDEGVIFYVGKGKERRAWEFKAGRNKWHRHIVSKLGDLGLSVDVRIIEHHDDEKAAFFQERGLISHWRSMGAHLVNVTDGGEGQSGYVHTEETREKLRIKMTGRKMTPEWRAKIGKSNTGREGWSRGKKLSASHIEAVANAHRGAKRCDQARANMRAAKSSPEWKEAFGAKYRGVKKSAAQIEKMRAANLGKTHGEQARKKVSEHNLKLWADPVYREKQRQARIAAWALRKATKALENRE